MCVVRGARFWGLAKVDTVSIGGNAEKLHLLGTFCLEGRLRPDSALMGRSSNGDKKIRLSARLQADDRLDTGGGLSLCRS